MSPETTRQDLEAYIAELRKRAKRAQEEARRELNPLFDDRGRPPRDFIESSFLFIRSCDADNGSRPLPCPVFWMSPDLRVAPLSNLGTPTYELQAGDAYRLTATVRNRGDLTVPSAKVEFWLVNPSLGFDTRYATKLGVAADRVDAYGANEVSLDYVVPPALSGHRCLFARVFSFSPLDVPVDDYALDPRIDRHVGQLNLNIVQQGSTFVLDWIHLQNAAETLELVPMTAAMLKPIRLETVTGLALESRALWKKLGGRVKLEAKPGEGANVEIERGERGLALTSTNPEAVSIERQLELTKQVQAALETLEQGGGNGSEFRGLFREYRAMTAQSVRTRVSIELPDLGLEPGRTVALNVTRRSRSSREPMGGIGLLIVGPEADV
jgi:hypothetical protein